MAAKTKHRKHYSRPRNREGPYREGLPGKHEPSIRTVHLTLDQSILFQYIVCSPSVSTLRSFHERHDEPESSSHTCQELSSRKDAHDVDYSSGFILGLPILYTEQLVDQFSIPEGVWQYELANGNTCPWILMEATDSNDYNSFGTVLSLTPIPLGRYGLRRLQEYAVDLDGRALTLQEYLLYGM